MTAPVASLNSCHHTSGSLNLMPLPKNKPVLTRAEVVRLWLARQGLLQIESKAKLNKSRFVQHLENTGGLQIDSVNVIDRAHYLTLWSRFGAYNRNLVDKWVYKDRVAYEYWGHEASILPVSHLPFGKRRMRDFPPESWKNASYWKHYLTSDASKNRVLKAIKNLGPLESNDFERSKLDEEQARILGWGSLIPKEDKRSLQLLWHSGKLAIHSRNHFRKVYDLAENIYPACRPATKNQYLDSWLLTGLKGCGVATESHLVNYFTGPNLKAPERRTVIDRNIKNKKVLEIEVQGDDSKWYATPESLEEMKNLPLPCGTTLICPFDSLLWQRKRAEDLLDFRYRVEIYVPEAKREHGYYVLPILHDGKLVGRLDPKLHRQESRLEIKNFSLEPNIKLIKSLRSKLKQSLESLAEFVNAKKLDLPRQIR